MNKFTRRDFLKALAAATACAIVERPLAALDLSNERAFEFLVTGDSLVWGQGLEEKDKFYSLTADWLRNDVFSGRRNVNLTVKAHSGSTLKFHKAEADKFRASDRVETHYYPSEVNVSFPSIWKQLEVAKDEYQMAGSPGADLIMVSGGITDITTARVFDPKGNNDELRSEIRRFCENDMYDVLERATELHPNALIAVIGYYPAITESSSKRKLLNAWLEALKFPRPFKPFANNPLIRPLFFNGLRKKAIERSWIWYEESNKSFIEATERINEKFGKQKAVFIRSPLEAINATEAPKTLLFRMGKGGVVKDPMAKRRIADCRSALPELKRATGVDYPVRLCEIAAIGHPDQKGAKAYFEAIRDTLSPILRSRI